MEFIDKFDTTVVRFWGVFACRGGCTARGNENTAGRQAGGRAGESAGGQAGRQGL